MSIVYTTVDNKDFDGMWIVTWQEPFYIHMDNA